MNNVALKITKEAKDNQFDNCDINGAEVSGTGNIFKNSYFKKFISNWLVDAVEKLGALGTISFVGAFLLIYVTSQVNFETQLAKALVLSVSAMVLLIFSGIIYYLRVIDENLKVKAALEVLKEVYNRLAEQTAKTEKDQTVSITMTIDNLPTKIAEVIRNTTLK